MKKLYAKEVEAAQSQKGRRYDLNTWGGSAAGSRIVKVVETNQQAICGFLRGPTGCLRARNQCS